MEGEGESSFAPTKKRGGGRGDISTVAPISRLDTPHFSWLDEGLGG